MNNIELRWAKSRSAPFIDATITLQYRTTTIGVSFGSTPQWSKWIDVPEVYISDKDEA